MSAAVRNVLIIVALAAIVFAVPGGDDGAAFIGAVLSLAITVTFALIAARFYRERRVDIHSLGDRWRAVLYLALAGVIFAIAGASKLFDSGPGMILWFAVVGAAVYGLVATWQHWRADNAY